MELSEFKREAAERAVGCIESGMVVGLGHGSTAVHAARRLAEMLKTGQLRNILGVPCSLAVEKEALELGIPLTTFEQHQVVDLTIDGADEVDPNLDLIKGGGGALLREKIVAQASRREIIVIDESKLSPALGSQWAVPVEVVPFGWHSQTAYLESLGATWQLRRKDDGSPFMTDQGNCILDCKFGAMQDPAGISSKLSRLAMVVEHGLFLGIATDVIVAGFDGVRHLKRAD